MALRRLLILIIQPELLRYPLKRAQTLVLRGVNKPTGLWQEKRYRQSQLCLMLAAKTKSIGRIDGWFLLEGPLRPIVLAFGCLLLFWLNGLWHLDRFPSIQFDEPTILAPGYKFFRQGVYGSDLYTGFHNQEQRYLEVTPLMPLVQGFSSWLWGVGVWQMRYSAIAAGTLTIALIHAVGRRLIGNEGAMIAVLLALLWPWSPGGGLLFGTGIALVDITRIARYDILVPVFGLASLWSGLLAYRGRETPFASLGVNPSATTMFIPAQWLYPLSAGTFVGLAGLANIYGLFWGVALGAIYVLEALFFEAKQVKLRITLDPTLFKPLLSLLLGLVIVWLPWLAMSVWYWDDMVGQFSKHTGRLDFTSLSFYIQNLGAEIHRYRLFPYGSQTYLRLGFWLFIVGLPAACLYTGRQALVKRDRRAFWLLISTLIFVMLLAVLEEKKRYYYVASLTPLFVIVLAGGLTSLLYSAKSTIRLLVIVLLVLTCSQGGKQIIQMHLAASQVRPPTQFFVELQQVVPNASRIMGPVQYWLANPAWDYRATPLMYHLSAPENSAAIPFATALKQIAPEVILVPPDLYEGLDISTRYYQGQTRYREVFERFMNQHQAKLIAEVIDYEGHLIQVYQLTWER